MTTPKMKSTLMTNLIEVLTIIGIVLLIRRSLAKKPPLGPTRRMKLDLLGQLIGRTLDMDS